MNETKQQRLNAIIKYIEDLGNPIDAEFLKEISTQLHDSYHIIAFLKENRDGVVPPKATTTIGNTMALLSPYKNND